MEAKAKKKFNLPFYIAFIVATIAITKFFTSNHYFKAGEDLLGYIVIAVSLIVLALSSLFMAFEIYSEEKEKNNLRVTWSLFEYLYKRFKAN